MKSIDVVLGLQWGDEGKGKVVDVLAPRYDVVARFQGGPNAGHSVCFNGTGFVLHTVPSGIFRQGSVNIIGNGVVVDPVILMEEVAQIEANGIRTGEKLKIAKRASLILPTHRILDAAQEASKGKSKIGSTLKGIGPAYTDKAGRASLRIGDISAPDFKERYATLKAAHLREISSLGYTEFDITEYEQRWFAAVEAMTRFEFIDNEVDINRRLDEGATVLAEGAQGSLLDIDFGTYPFVTSSSTLCAGACTGLGVAPSRIGQVFGIFKAYCTRVGSGPFPTELDNETGDTLRRIGGEYGATTGRPRRCGWLDLVALKYTVKLNGATALIMMKCDVLSGFDTIRVCTGYEMDGRSIDWFPYEAADRPVTPIYKEFKGWKGDLSGIRTYDALPVELKDYIASIERYTGVPVKVISIGKDRDATLFR